MQDLVRLGPENVRNRSAGFRGIQEERTTFQKMMNRVRPKVPKWTRRLQIPEAGMSGGFC